MEHSTGIPASTVHRALGLLANEDGQYGDPEMLDADLILVDEVSMLDIYLAEKLLKATPRNARLILVGDSDQLPPVGAGNVLQDLIESEMLPVVRLTQVFRQAMESKIITTAHKIVAGENPDLTNDGKDYFHLERTAPALAAQTVTDL